MKLDSNTKTSSEQVAQIIRELPATARVHGTGWWQAPVISFLSQKQFYDIDNVELTEFNINDENYFVVDQYLYSFSKEAITSLLDRAHFDVVYKSEAIYLYKINHLSPYKPFTGEERDADLLSFVDFSQRDYAYTRGLYSYETNFRWSRLTSAILLKYSSQKYLFISLYIPNREAYNSNDVWIAVNINDEFSSTYQITKSGVFKKYIEVNKHFPGEQGVVVELKINKRCYPPKAHDNRVLGFIISKIGFATYKN